MLPEVRTVAFSATGASPTLSERVVLSMETEVAGSATRTKQVPYSALPSVVVAVIWQVPMIFGFSLPA